jgi:uncharacterized protein (TIGR03083 family)
VFGEQRQRFVTVLQGFGPGDWAAPTRCADWSAHDVVRHLCDANAITTGTDDRTLDISAGFDPRITPRGWLTASAGESPDATLGRLVATTEELLVLARDRCTRQPPVATTPLTCAERLGPGRPWAGGGSFPAQVLLP